jgi:hypothetical protein
MNQALQAIFDLIDCEFDGKSWNGPSLMATLAQLDATAAASQATWEGYSAWELAIHCSSCKFIIAEDLGLFIPEWTYGRQLFGQATDTSPAAWLHDQSLFRLVHTTCLTALRQMPADHLALEMPSWKSPWLEVIAWLTTHDAFHGAQIRSMGLPALKTAKHLK